MGDGGVIITQGIYNTYISFLIEWVALNSLAQLVMRKNDEITINMRRRTTWALSMTKGWWLTSGKLEPGIY